VGILLLVAGCTRDTVITEQITEIISPEDAKYIGSDQCGVDGCHPSTYADFIETGHPYKLNDAAAVAQGNYYPFSDVPNPPSGYSWPDIDRVIGGFWWKARFIRPSGSIITGPEVQYNLADESWTAYHDGESINYDCGPCHMTAYVDTGHQDGHDSLIGTWAFDGVQCEECHGPGEFHAAAPYGVSMKIDRSAEGCGKCHIRGDVESIPASGGFIRHHEQWNEMFVTKHASLECIDCHDPHIGLHPNNPSRESAIRVQCENCHAAATESFLASPIGHADNAHGPDCVACHMAKAAKSALAVGPYEADVHSHLWRINADVDAEMFSEDGSTANGYLTLEYTCLQCHSSKDKAWAASYAGAIHAGPASETADCFSCHGIEDWGPDVTEASAQWAVSVHASGDNIGFSFGSCAGCHTSEGFVAAVEDEDYDGDAFNAIGCFTCHAPHETESFVLRTSDPVTLGNGATYDKGPSNICANCHKSRQNVDTYVVDGGSTSSRFGPHHGPQSDMLIGENAYKYDDYPYTNSAHMSTTTEGCVDCHFDEGEKYVLGGHTFMMRDVATGDQHINDCNVLGCHNGSEEIDSLNRVAAADFDWDGNIEGVQDEIEGLLDSLATDLIAANLLEYDADDDAYDPIARSVELADSAGALFNFKFVEEDRSLGIHNTDFAVGLLQSSINYLVTGDPNGSPPGWVLGGMISAH
jgi:hypothetical protein